MTMSGPKRGQVAPWMAALLPLLSRGSAIYRGTMPSGRCSNDGLWFSSCLSFVAGLCRFQNHRVGFLHWMSDIVSSGLCCSLVSIAGGGGSARAAWQECHPSGSRAGIPAWRSFWAVSFIAILGTHVTWRSRGRGRFMFASGNHDPRAGWRLRSVPRNRAAAGNCVRLRWSFSFHRTPSRATREVDYVKRVVALLPATHVGLPAAGSA